MGELTATAPRYAKRGVKIIATATKTLQNIVGTNL
jgi:hypothetical protein